ncbi:MAG TPA: hypothetical protein VL634_01120 [Mycobacterium sp.]|nr:hypothetical protein [Mycobacterium sp.]
MVVQLTNSVTSFLGNLSWVPWAVVLVGVPILGPMLVRRMRKIRGPVVAGTAEVLSLRQFGSVAVNGPERMICRLRLGVNVPGREPYSVAIWRNIAPWDLGGFQKGSTIAVEVSETNPRKVQLGRSRTGGTGPTRQVVNLPPQVTFNQSSWSPETGWTGSPPPGDIADQIKAAVQGAFQPSVAQQADAYRQMGGAGQVLSAAALLASGQRVPAALKSFAPTGTTPRSLGRTPSRPELIDAPHYMLEVELHFPNLEPIDARAVQPVPVAHVPSLAVGLPLTCAVDPSDPSRRFVVDWDATR